jgi:death on curing protein
MINDYQLSYRDEQEEMELAYTIESMVADKSFDILVNWIETHIIPFEG